MENELKKDVEQPKGKLYIVSTPIGNMDDITLRAIKVLKKCDLIICEEIKEGAYLLKKLNISKKLDTLNEQNEESKTQFYIEQLLKGRHFALISDGGTPILADPGSKLLQAALYHKIDIEVVPGPTSIITALVRSGFDLSQFLYAGFLSRLKDERVLQLKHLAEEARTVVLLETPYRLLAILEAAASVMPNRNAYIGMNLTTQYETHHYGTFKELFDKFNGKRIKGEFVICFEGKSYSDSVSRMKTIKKDSNKKKKPIKFKKRRK